MINSSEKLDVYDLDSKFISVQDRDEFYNKIKSEFKKTGKITQKVKTIRFLLMNSLGCIYLQKRSDLKNENAGLYDKTVGGHVSAGDNYKMTIIRECTEELGIPIAVLQDDEFKKSVNTTDLQIVGICKEIDYTPTFNSIRINKDGSKIIQPMMNRMYVGYYDGAIRFVDGESSGVEVFTLKSLKEKIDKRPEDFTEDIKFIIKKYEKLLIPVNKIK